MACRCSLGVPPGGVADHGKYFLTDHALLFYEERVCQYYLMCPACLSACHNATANISSCQHANIGECVMYFR